MTRTRLMLMLATGAAIGALAGASSAAAHIGAEPAEIQAGVPATVGFIVEHGCGDEDTTGLLFQIPPGVTDLTGVEQPGWTVSSDEETVSFTGGPLDHDTAGTFELSFTAPAVAGRLDFPMVQQCGDTELRWIEIAEDGAEEPEHPAPRVDVVGEAPAPTTTAAAATTTAAAPDTTPAEATTTAAAPETTPAEATTTAASTVPPDTTVAADTDDSDDGGSAWPIIIGLIVAAAIGAGIAVVVSKRRAASSGATKEG